ncbi:MAG: response regulator [Chitinophagaceae bacterium]
MNTKIKILHLEDAPSDAELIRILLKKSKLNFETLVVSTREQYIHALDTYCPDIILSDHSLPAFDSHAALAILHQSGKHIPFILITAVMSDEYAVDIIKKGADDYLLKDRPSRLPSAIQASLEKFRLEAERKVIYNELIDNE